MINLLLLYFKLIFFKKKRKIIFKNKFSKINNDYIKIDFYFINDINKLLQLPNNNK